VTSNLTNPKMAVFASSWWVTYVLLLHRADALLQRPRVQHALERVTGLVLIGLGLRLATQHPWPGTSSGPVP
jgi:threonine/homoserine/homoserine lactone efflux protein